MAKAILLRSQIEMKNKVSETRVKGILVIKLQRTFLIVSMPEGLNGKWNLTVRN